MNEREDIVRAETVLMRSRVECGRVRDDRLHSLVLHSAALYPVTSTGTNQASASLYDFQVHDSANKNCKTVLKFNVYVH